MLDLDNVHQMTELEVIRANAQETRMEIIEGNENLIERLQEAGEVLAAVSHGCAYASGWWTDVKTGQDKDRNNGEMMMLMVSEIAEAMEGDRKKKMDNHLPHRLNVEVELADAVIRIFDFAGARGLNLGAAIFEKIQYNMSREDHKIENRIKEGGKAY